MMLSRSLSCLRDVMAGIEVTGREKEKRPDSFATTRRRHQPCRESKIKIAALTNCIVFLGECWALVIVTRGRRSRI